MILVDDSPTSHGSPNSLGSSAYPSPRGVDNTPGLSKELGGLMLAAVDAAAAVRRKLNFGSSPASENGASRVISPRKAVDEYTFTAETLDQVVDAVMIKLHGQKAVKAKYKQAIAYELKTARQEFDQAQENVKLKLPNALKFLKEAKLRFLQASRAAVESLLRYTLENKKYLTDQHSYLRPSDTGLAVPLTISGKKIVFSLKSKLGERLGIGESKIVKTALDLSLQGSSVTIKEAASATMTLKSAKDKETAANEISKLQLLATLSRLSQPAGVIECIAVTPYNDKSNTFEKIGVIMELCKSGSLQDTNKFTASERRAIIHDILSGLTWLHKNSIFHSDLKPANILLTGEEGNRRAKISDFGCARNLNVPEEQIYLGGDFSYFAPEMVQMVVRMGETIETDHPRGAEYKSEKARLREAITTYQNSELAVTKKEEVLIHSSEKARFHKAMARYQNSELAVTENEETPIQSDDIEYDKMEFEKAIAKRDLDLETCKVLQKKFKLLEDSLVSVYRQKLYALDRTALKGDVFSAGKIIEGLFGSLDLSDAMRALINDMKKQDPNERIDAEEALRRFEAIPNVDSVDSNPDSESEQPEGICTPPSIAFTGYDLPSAPIFTGYGLPM